MFEFKADETKGELAVKIPEEVEDVCLEGDFVVFSFGETLKIRMPREIAEECIALCSKLREH